MITHVPSSNGQPTRPTTTFGIKKDDKNHQDEIPGNKQVDDASDAKIHQNDMLLG